MKTIQYNTLLWNVGFNQAETAAEYNTAAKAKDGVDECLASANSNEAYRGQMPEFRDKIVALIETETKIARNTKTETRKAKDGTTKEVTVIDEKDGVYLKRVAATLFPGAAEATDKLAAQFATQAATIAAAIPFDPSETEKKAKTAKAPKFAKHITETVDGMITAGKAERLARYLTKVLGHEVAADAAALYAGVAEEEVIESRKRLANKVG